MSSTERMEQNSFAADASTVENSLVETTIADEDESGENRREEDRENLEIGEIEADLSDQ